MTVPDNNRSKQELSKAILHTANHLFKEHGVESVSMHQIAKSAGIGQGTLYRRYSNKSDLCMEMMKGNFNQFSKEIELYLLEAEHVSVQQRLRDIMRKIVIFVDKESSWLGVVQSSNHQQQSKFDFFQTPPYHFLHNVLSGLLIEAIDKGLVHPIDPEYTAHSIIAVQSPHMYMQLRDVVGYTCEEIQDRCCQTTIDPLFL